MIEKITKIVGGHANPYFIIFIFLVLAVLDVLGISMVPILIESAMATNSDSVSHNWLMVLLPIIPGYEAVWVLSIIVLFLFFIKSVVFVASNYLVYNFSYKVMHQNRAELISLLLDSYYQTIINKSAADFINLLQLHINQSVSNYLVPSLKLISDILVASLILGYLLVTHTNITLALLLITISLSYMYLQIFRSRLYGYGKKSYIHNHIMIDLAKSIRTGFVDIVVNGGISYFKKTFHKESLGFSNIQIKSATIRVVPRPLLEWIVILFVIILVLANSKPGNNTLLVTILATFGMAAMRLLPAATSIIASLTIMKNSEAVVEKYFLEKQELVTELRNTRNKYDEVKEISENDICRITSLSVKNVSFSYEEGKELLNSINLSIKKGETIGIVGSSGSGKSTLVSIITGLLKPVKGQVCLDTNNVLDLNTSSYFSYVPQFPFISNDTLLNNIVYPGCECDLPRIKILMEALGLTELVNGKVASLDDVVGEKGITLSGGQAQRIALIRAILQDKEILIIDEATSALDHESSNRVLDVLNEIKTNKIIIIISHRKEILELCDHIYKLENGLLNEIQK